MMTQYDATFDAPVDVPAAVDEHLLGEVVAAAGKHQLRMAETEKYPHVTYFFNGGVETPNPGEDRDMAPSPKVATYDLQPEMSAVPLTDEVHRAPRHRHVRPAHPELTRTPTWSATPACSRRRSRRSRRSTRASSAWWKKSSRSAARCLITADHGNCEREINDDGTPNTAHTTNLVQFIYAGPNADKA